MADSSDGDDDSYTDQDNRNRIIDVERDAAKLRRKYGNNVVQTFQEQSHHLQESRSRDKSILNAPYLGSLSRSANQVLSLPPMSLAGGTLLSSTAAMEEPPESLTSYGSLRDSHERGQFLDGPSSYREPTSGRIRQLDHRVRYHGRTPPEISIGERMQQTRRLREMRQKELAAKGNSGGGGTGSGIDVGGSDETVDGKPEALTTQRPGTATSSLSAMLDEASKKMSQMTMDTDETGAQVLPIQSTSIPSLGRTERQRGDGNGNERGMSNPSHMMLSTSLTAFEVLKSSNTHRKPTGVYGLRGQQTAFLSSRSLAGADGINAAAPTGQVLTESQASITHTAATQDNNGVNSLGQIVRGEGFQPLSRSLSDPTHQIQQHYSLRERTALIASPTYGTTSTQPPSPFLPFSLPPPGHPGQPYFSHTLAAVSNSNVGFVLTGDTSQVEEEEGAFGDIME